MEDSSPTSIAIWYHYIPLESYCNWLSNGSLRVSINNQAPEIFHIQVRHCKHYTSLFAHCKTSEVYLWFEASISYVVPEAPICSARDGIHMCLSGQQHLCVQEGQGANHPTS